MLHFRFYLKFDLANTP